MTGTRYMRGVGYVSSNPSPPDRLPESYWQVDPGPVPKPVRVVATLEEAHLDDRHNLEPKEGCLLCTL